MSTVNKPISAEAQSDDLISRNVLKEDIELLLVSIGGQPVFHKEAKRSVLKLIDEQPVAKDALVTKLMAENERLRAERDYAISCVTPRCDCCARTETCEYANTGWKNPYDCFTFGGSRS